MRLALALPFALLAQAANPGGEVPVIHVKNEAQVPAAELESIRKDLSVWAARVYDYNQVRQPRPVTLQLTRRVSFGFYRNDTVIMPPDEDRWEMLDNWVHELTHHATGHDSSFFFKEGIAVHTLETLFRQQDRVPQPWPQFGHSTDAWVNLYLQRGRLMDLEEALAWPHYRGDTPDNDFRSWQIYNQAGSFIGWYIGRYGYPAFRESFKAEWPREDSAKLEREWLESVRAKKLPLFDPAKALPSKARYRAYAERLKP